MSRLTRSLLAAALTVAMTSAALAAEPPAGDSADRQAVLAVLTKIESTFAEGDAKALASCWATDGEFIGPAGADNVGRESIEKLFKDAFAAHKGIKLHLHVQHFRLVNASLALVDALATVKPAVSNGGTPLTSFVLVKQEGGWLIASARETTTHVPSQANHLNELQWMIGNWSSAASKAGISFHSSCDWTASRAFLIRKFQVGGKGVFLHGGTEVIGWDPRTNGIRSWVFDSDGGFGENVWVRDGNRWLIKYSGTLADGSTASATHVLTHTDENTASLQSRDRTVNGAVQPDIPEMVINRQAAANAPAKTEAPSKPAEKSAP